jgi:hypothetical protein
MTKPLSLCEWISEKGGIRLFRNQGDTVGASDLRAIGADSWHRAAPFRKKLTRLESGMCPDDCALAAWEQGYFPDCTERPEIQDLIDAIERELSGRLVYRLEDEREIYELELAAWEREQSMEMLRQASAHVPGRVIPPGSVLVAGMSGDVVALYEVHYVTKKTGRQGKNLYAKAFRAGEYKPSWHHVYPNEQARMDAANAFFAENMEGVF